MATAKHPPVRAVFMIPPLVHLLDITGPAHIFYEAACYGAPVQSIFSAVFSDRTDSDSSCSLAFTKLTPYDQLQLSAGDIVFIPGLESSLLLTDDFLHDSRPFQYWLAEQHRKGVRICSTCTGAFLLAAAGLLTGRACTTHWKYMERFARRYPQARLQANRLFVEEDHIYTSAGVSSGIDLALYLTEQLWGAHFAAQVAKEVVIYFRRTPEDPQLSIFTQYRNHLDQRIHIVQDRLAQSLSQKLSIEALADEVSMSPRNLTRLFKKTNGITVGAYLEKLRAERAGQLIGEGHTLQAAALQCGLKNSQRLRQLLNRQFPSKNL